MEGQIMTEDFQEILRRRPGVTGGYSDYSTQPASFDTKMIQRSNPLLPALVAAAGAVLIAVSPVLPWVHITAPFFGSMNFSLLDGLRLAGSGGLLVFVLAIFIAGGLGDSLPRGAEPPRR
jgi:hypothetical protein